MEFRFFLLLVCFFELIAVQGDRGSYGREKRGRQEEKDIFIFKIVICEQA